MLSYPRRAGNVLRDNRKSSSGESTHEDSIGHRPAARRAGTHSLLSGHQPRRGRLAARFVVLAISCCDFRRCTVIDAGFVPPAANSSDGSAGDAKLLPAAPRAGHGRRRCARPRSPRHGSTAAERHAPRWYAPLPGAARRPGGSGHADPDSRGDRFPATRPTARAPGACWYGRCRRRRCD